MGEAWLKIVAWTKGIVLGLAAIYAIIFLAHNADQDISFWWWFDHKPKVNAFILVIFSFLAGIIATVLVSTSLKTLKQIRDVRTRSRLDRLERTNADVMAKAAMLQTRPIGGDGVTVQVDNLGSSR